MNIKKSLNNEQEENYNTVFEEALEAYADNLLAKKPDSKFDIGDKVLVNILSPMSWLGSAEELLSEIAAPFGTEFKVVDSWYDVDDIFDHPGLPVLKKKLKPVFIQFLKDPELLYKLQHNIKEFFTVNKLNYGWLYTVVDSTKKVNVPDDFYIQEELLLPEKSKAGYTYKRLMSYMYEEKMLKNSLTLLPSEDAPLINRIKLTQHNYQNTRKQLSALF